MAASKNVGKFYSEHLYTSKTFVSLQCVYQSRFFMKNICENRKRKKRVVSRGIFSLNY